MSGFVNGIVLAMALIVVLYPWASHVAPDWGWFTIGWYIAWGYSVSTFAALIYFRLTD